MLPLACDGGKVKREECAQMLDRYLDMVIAGEPSHAKLPPAESLATLQVKRAARKAEPGYRRVQVQCEAEISRREFRCAMSAPTPESWQACID